MKLFILRWNPNISSYKKDEHLTIINHVKDHQQPTDFGWSIHEHKELQKDDLFILQQVGTDNDGIAMIGKFKDRCYEADSWRNDGSKDYFADIWIMDAFDCDSENPLPANRYEKLFPEIKWHGGHSGVVVEEDLDDNLVNEIEKDLIKAGIWKEGELDKFVAWDFEQEFSDDKLLLAAKDLYLKTHDKDDFVNFICCLIDTKVLIPMHVEEQNGEDRYFPLIITNDEGVAAIPVFSNEEQVGDHYQEDGCEFYDIPISLCIDILKDDNQEQKDLGIVLDPFTNSFLIDRELADLIIQIQNQNVDQ